MISNTDYTFPFNIVQWNFNEDRPTLVWVLASHCKGNTHNLIYFLPCNLGSMLLHKYSKFKITYVMELWGIFLQNMHWSACNKYQCTETNLAVTFVVIYAHRLASNKSCVSNYKDKLKLCPPCSIYTAWYVAALKSWTFIWLHRTSDIWQRVYHSAAFI